MTSSLSVGSHSLTATYSGSYPSSTSSVLTQVVQGTGTPQTISWTQSLSGAVNDNIPLTATASSGLAVSYIGTAGICTASGATLSLVGTGTCTVTASQPGNGSYAAAANVTKSFTVGPQVWSVTPTGLTFGGQPINSTSAAQAITIKNVSSTSLKVTNVSLAGSNAGDFIKSNGCASLAPSASCTVSVSFKPAATGSRMATLSITNSASTKATIITLSGAGVAAAPVISISATSINFGNQFINEVSTPKSLTIANKGSAVLTISSVVTSGTDAASFTRTGSCTSIAIGASCTSYSYTFKPTTTGAKTASFDINSNAYGSATTKIALSGIASAISQYAGTSDGPGFANGSGAVARFNAPSGIILDSLGNLYVTEAGNNLIRKITSAGSVSTLAGQTLVAGSSTGSGTAAVFNKPTGIAINGSTLYVADTDNQVVRKVTTSGSVSAFVGSVGLTGAANGTGTSATFNRPQGVTVDGSGNVFIADTDNGTIRKANSANAVSLFAGTAGSQGGTDGTGATARFTKPTGIGRDASNNLYVTDTAGQTVRKITSTAVVTTFAGNNGSSGSTDSVTGTSARFSSPSGAVVDSAGNIFVSDAANGTVRKITSAGAVTTFAGTAGSLGSNDATGAAARFYRPVGMAKDASNNLYVTDPVAHTVRKISTGGIVTTFAGFAAVVGANDNTGAAASFRGPSGVVADSTGNLYVADTGNHTIRKITPAGVVTTFAGFAGSAGSADATGTAARFNGPTGLAIDPSNNIYVADTGNHTIRKITSGGVVSTIAGLATTTGSTDGTGTAARFKSPAAIVVTSTTPTTLYVADTGNYTIRKIVLSSGAVTTLAGSAGVSGAVDNATGTSARFGLVYGIGLDNSGNVFVADYSANTIRKIVTTGNIAVSTFAGTANSRGTAGTNTTPVTGSSARFSSPYAIALDASNNIYVGDYANCTIRKITSLAVVTTPVGTAGTCKFAPADAPPTINMPTGLVKVGSTLYLSAGNGVAAIANMP